MMEIGNQGKMGAERGGIMQRQEITKEQYEQVITSEDAIELGILPPHFVYYGFKSFRKLEVAGKYYIEYQLYSSCD